MHILGAICFLAFVLSCSQENRKLKDQRGPDELLSDMTRLNQSGREAEGLALAKEFVEETSKVLGEDSPQYYGALIVLGNQYLKANLLLEADSVLSIAERQLESYPVSEEILLSSYRTHGTVCTLLRDYQRAEKLFKMATMMKVARSDSLDRSVIEAFGLLSAYYVGRGQFASAIPYLEQIEDWCLVTNGDTDSLCLNASVSLMTAYLAEKRFEDIPASFNRSFDRLRTTENSFLQMQIRRNLIVGIAHRELGDAMEASRYIAEAIRISQVIGDTSSVGYGDLTWQYGKLLALTARPTEAIEYFELTLRLTAQQYGLASKEYSKLAGLLVNFYRHAGRNQRADELDSIAGR